MIELKLTGRCEGCTFADVVQSCEYADNEIISDTITCVHQDVCDMWQARMYQALALAIQPEEEQT